MALLRYEGFDILPASMTTASLLPWAMGMSPGSSFATLETVTGQYGGKALQFDNANDALSIFVPGRSEAFCGVKLKFSAAISGTINVLEFRYPSGTAANDYNVQIRIASTGVVSARRGTTTLGSSASGAWPMDNAWHRLEVRHVVHASTGIVEVRIDGTTVLNLSGVNTKQSIYHDTTGAVIIEAGGYTFHVDDFYYLDTTGAAPTNTFLGNWGVDSSTALVDEAANFTVVGAADVQSAIGTVNNIGTSWLEAQTAGSRMILKTSHTTKQATAVLAVQWRVIAHKDRPAVKRVKPFVISKGTEVQATNDRYLPSSAAFTDGMFLTTDPKTGGNWTLKSVNAAKYGLEIIE